MRATGRRPTDTVQEEKRERSDWGSRARTIIQARHTAHQKRDEMVLSLRRQVAEEGSFCSLGSTQHIP